MKRGQVNRGHRLRSHTADVIIDAWGPDLAALCEEAATALVETYVDRAPDSDLVETSVEVPAGRPVALVLAVLEEVIFALDTAEAGVPVRVGVAPTRGGLVMSMALAPPDAVEGTGMVPKAISRSGLRVDPTGTGWRTEVLVDV